MKILSINLTNKLAILAFLSAFSLPLQAANYIIDTKGAHAFIQFKIQHLGYSWLYGRFNTFDGHFTYDEKQPEKSKISVNIDPASVDSNHAERDKHLRGAKFLHVSEYPKSSFISTRFEPLGNNNAKLYGKFTLHGVTKDIVIDVEKIGQGADPWGGERVGFYGTTRLALADYDIVYNLGPASTHVELELSVEGIKEK